MREASESTGACLAVTERTTHHRMRENGRTNRADLDAVLAAGFVCHLGVVLDGTPMVVLVPARSVFEHSVNYRCAMVYGVPRGVTDPEQKLEGPRVLSEQAAPGQWDYARQPSREELPATTLLALRLDEAGQDQCRPARRCRRPGRRARPVGR